MFRALAFLACAGITGASLHHLLASETRAESLSVGQLEHRELAPPHAIALALDVSRSMTGERLEATQSAAEDFVTTLFASDVADQKLEMALVPYSARVNVGAWLARTGISVDQLDGCVEEPLDGMIAHTKTPQAQKWNSSTDIDLVGWHQIGGNWVYGSYRADVPCAAPVQPLSRQSENLVNAIKDLQAGGTARPDLALLWAWRMLDPTWQGVENAAAAQPRKRRSIVLVSDGQSATSYSRVSQKRVHNHFQELCRVIQGEGIEIYVIAIEAPSSPPKMLRRCTTGDHIVEARSLGQIAASFEKLGVVLRSPLSGTEGHPTH